VAAVALALLRAEHGRDLDLVAAVLPQRDAAGHRAHVAVAEELVQRVRGERGALAGGAVEDDVRVAVGDRALDARLEIAARDVLGAGMWPASHSSLSRTSISVTSVPEVLGDLGGSTSRICCLICRMTSAPDGLIAIPQKSVGIQYFRK
jgi:hypothetical protein